MGIYEKDTQLYYFNNPLVIQEDILDDLEKRLEDKGYVVSDINNTFGFCLEAFSTIVSKCVMGIERKLESLYPKRAKSLEDLYNHLSDFDYVNFQASPAYFKINVIIPKKFIISQAKEFNDFYKLLVIPKDTVFTVGNIPFSLYYHVLIKVNKITNNVLISYDVSESNPLYSLKNYDILFKTFYYRGVEYISFELPIYQFSKTSIQESIDTNVGYIKEISFENKFYAIRIFDVINNTEFNYSFSDIVYDPYNPTAIVKIIQDENILNISIPQIYFTNNQVSSKIKIDVYTTLGKLDLNVDETDSNIIQASYFIDSDHPYMEAVDGFRNIPAVIFKPASNKILGGSDNLNFEEVKKNIIYNLYNNKVPISNMDINNFFAKDGFKVLVQKDNLTERTFYCLKHVTDENGEKISLVNSDLTLNFENLDQYGDRVKVFADNKIVILPNAIMEYSGFDNRSRVLSDDEARRLENLPSEQLIEELNTNTYTRNIYHTLIKTDDSYPVAKSFDLISCSAENLLFLHENPYISYQCSATDVSLEHLNNGCGGYRLLIGVQKSKELEEVPEEDFLVHVGIQKASGGYVGTKANFLEKYNDLYIYEAIISTDYYLTENYISLTGLETEPSYSGKIYIPYNTKAKISYFVRNTYAENTPQSPTIYDDILIGYYYGDDFIAISNQSCDICFGKSLEDYIHNPLVVTFNPQEYERYEESVIMQYESDIYERTEQGTLKFTIDEQGNVHLYKKHSAGEPVLLEDYPIFKAKFLIEHFETYDDHVLIQFNTQYALLHLKGDIKLDEFGNPIPIKNRYKNFTVSTIQLDLKYYYCDSFNLKSMYETLQAYFSIIKEKENNLYGNTNCYFKPINTLGKDYFIIKNDITTLLDLQISVKLRVIVEGYVIQNDELLKTLEYNIKQIIKDNLSNQIFSLVEISNYIKQQFPDYIKTIEVLGINDNIEIQSLTKTNNDKDISIKKTLYIDSDGNYNLQDNIFIEFVSLT